jgi:hypothetical protein
VSSLPRGRRCSRDHRDVRDRRLPPCNGWPLPPQYRTPTRDVRLTRHQQGFRVIHPSGLPLTCSPRSERAPSGFSLSFAPGRYQPRTSRRGRVWNTNPKSRPRRHAEPPIDELTHNVRHRVAPPGSAAMRDVRTTTGHRSRLPRGGSRQPGSSHAAGAFRCSARLRADRRRVRGVRREDVPLQNRTRIMTCSYSGGQAAREYSLIRPPRTGLRWIRPRSRSATVRRPPSYSPSGAR